VIDKSVANAAAAVADIVDGASIMIGGSAPPACPTS
jgi:acyl CoA:acetate/3-ketoacid CoA transferase alpha subunit